MSVVRKNRTVKDDEDNRSLEDIMQDILFELRLNNEYLKRVVGEDMRSDVEDNEL